MVIRWARRLRVLIVFVDPPLLALFSLQFLFLFLLGLRVLWLQHLYRVVVAL